MYIIIPDINVQGDFEILNNLYIYASYIIMNDLLFYDTAIFTVVFEKASTKYISPSCTCIYNKIPTSFYLR